MIYVLLFNHLIVRSSWKVFCSRNSRKSVQTPDCMRKMAWFATSARARGAESPHRARYIVHVETSELTLVRGKT